MRRTYMRIQRYTQGNHYIAALISMSLDLYRKAIQQFLQRWLVRHRQNLQRMADLMKRGYDVLWGVESGNCSKRGRREKRELSFYHRRISYE